jgi:hypothetical protein
MEDREQEEVDGRDGVEEAFAPAVAQGATELAKRHRLEEIGEIVTKVPQGGGEGQDHGRTRIRGRATGRMSCYPNERCVADGTCCQMSTSTLS